MTEEINFKALCELAVRVCDVSKTSLLSKTRKRKIQSVRAALSYIAINEEDMDRNMVAKILKRDRTAT